MSGPRPGARPGPDDVRRIALSLPETTEVEAWAMPTFRVAGKMFITMPDDESSFAVRCPRLERGELIAAEPEKFWVPPTKWLELGTRRLAALEDMTELRDILVDSWQQAAPSRLLETFTAPGPHAG